MADNSTINANMYQTVNVDPVTFQPLSLKNQFYLPPGGGFLGAVKQGQNITIAPDGTISSTGGGGGGGSVIAIPYTQFTSSATPSANQTFASPNIALFENDPTNAIVVVNGAVITPLVSYNISGNTLTILDFLDASSIIQVHARDLGTSSGGGGGGGTVNYNPTFVTFTNSGFTTTSAQVAGDSTFTTAGTFTVGETIAFRNAFNAQIYTVAAQTGTTVTFTPALLAADAFASGAVIYNTSGALTQQPITDIALNRLTGTLNGTQLTINGTVITSPTNYSYRQYGSVANAYTAGATTIQVDVGPTDAFFFRTGLQVAFKLPNVSTNIYTLASNAVNTATFAQISFTITPALAAIDAVAQSDSFYVVSGAAQSLTAVNALVANSSNALTITNNQAILDIPGTNWADPGDTIGNLFFGKIYPSVTENGLGTGVNYGPLNGRVHPANQNATFSTGNLPAPAGDWTIGSSALISGNSVMVAADTALTTSTRAINSTDDGITWTLRTMPNDLLNREMAGNNSGFIVIGRGSGNVDTNLCNVSADGVTWTSSTLPATVLWESVAADVINKANNRFVAVANNSTTAAFTTNLGAAWTSATLPTSGNWQQVALSGLIAFVVGVNEGALSINGGATWTSVTLPTTTDNVQWVNVAMASTGSGTIIFIYGNGGPSSNVPYYSVSLNNGTTWSTPTLVPATFNIAYRGVYALNTAYGIFFYLPNSNNEFAVYDHAGNFLGIDVFNTPTSPFVSESELILINAQNGFNFAALGTATNTSINGSFSAFGVAAANTQGLIPIARGFYRCLGTPSLSPTFDGVNRLLFLQGGYGLLKRLA